MVERLFTEVIKAVLTQMMTQGPNPLAQQGMPGAQGLGTFPAMPDPFGAFANNGGACGAERFMGAPQSPLTGVGTMPNILPALPAAQPQQAASPCGCGSNFNDPRAVLTGFDAGQLFAQQLFNAVPGTTAGAVDPAALAGAGAPQGGLDATLLANGGAPPVFDALNVHQDLRNWTGGCGSKGCCKWEPAIA
jgi:hypothetical protein